MIPGRTYTEQPLKKRRSQGAFDMLRAYIANYDKQRRYYYRDEDNHRHVFEEQQFEGIYGGSGFYTAR
jgi:hypothetical protein